MFAGNSMAYPPEQISKKEASRPTGDAECDNTEPDQRKFSLGRLNFFTPGHFNHFGFWTNRQR